MRRRETPTSGDMSSIFYILCSVLLAVVFDQAFSSAGRATEDECLKQQEKCQNCSTDFFTTKLMLSASNEARNEVLKAQNIIMESGADMVVKLFSQYSLTTSLNYFCCLSDEEKKTVAVTLQENPGTIPQTLHYHGVDCMESNDGIIIMFILDEKSETYLKKWVSDVNMYFEDDIEVVDRTDPFNLQFAVVSNSYPLDTVLAKLNNINISFSFDFNRFYVSGVIIHFS